MRKRKCPYCYPKPYPMVLESRSEYERIWRCTNPEYDRRDSVIGGLHDIYLYKCGICNRWGSKTIVVDRETPTGYAHASCRDRELLHWTCSCGLEEYTQRGSGFGIFIQPKHKGEGHNLKVERTFKLGGKKIQTLMGREIAVKEEEN